MRGNRLPGHEVRVSSKPALVGEITLVSALFRRYVLDPRREDCNVRQTI
jgi:hypothetical protein